MTKEKIKVLELYSGIGGMHLALKNSGLDAQVVCSVDINQNANTVYGHNFPDTKLLNRNIQALTPQFINGLHVNTILMSPPCQPFTRNGLKLDVNDPRTSSFSYVLSILPELNIDYILIENVKGYESSEMRNQLIEALEITGFGFQEFILSPSQLCIPNTRHRYYCIAKRLPKQFSFTTVTNLVTDLPYKNGNDKPQKPTAISEILENCDKLTDYLIPDNFLRKRAMVVDICHPNSTRSCCFTKSYGRYITGTGSVFTQHPRTVLDAIYKELSNYEEGTDEHLECIRRLELRFFTPREVCRLMCFPDSFSFPDSVSDKQKYMLLGNSVNVKVVAELIKLLVDDQT